MRAQKRADKNSKSVQEPRMLGHYSKSDIRYWQQTIFRQTYTRDGETLITKNWAMKIAHRGRRETFPLGTANKAAGAARARDIYLSLIAAGWESTLVRYKKPQAIVHKRDFETGTVGVFLDAVFGMATNHMTVEGYAKRFRQIVSDIFGLSNGPAKHDYRRGGQQKWLEKVHSINLREITPDKVQDWKRSCLAQAGNDSLALRKARISVNSTIRQARSLFSRKMLRHLKLSLPDPLPFAGVDLEPRQSMKYRSEVDIKALVVKAEKDLSVSSPEAYKIFLLAVAAGLRRKEIDLLEWSSFRWEENVIRIQPTRYFHPKSEDSIADLPVDAEVMNLFRRYHESAKGPFVIRAKRPPLPGRPQQYYRCDPVFSTLA
jgi:hypothetical protein